MKSFVKGLGLGLLLGYAGITTIGTIAFAMLYVESMKGRRSYFSGYTRSSLDSLNNHYTSIKNNYPYRKYQPAKPEDRAEDIEEMLTQLSDSDK